MIRSALILLLSVSAALFAAERNPLAGTDLVSPAVPWEAACDPYGSSLDTAAALFKNGVATVSFTKKKMLKDGDYPYVELVCRPEGSLRSIAALSIQARCNRPLIVKLSQPALAAPPKGDDSYAFYQYTLPASPDSFRTVIVPLKSFRQPDWADAASRKIAFDPAAVNGIYFSPELSDETGGTAKLELQSIIPQH